jgi:hypothetical protein
MSSQFDLKNVVEGMVGTKTEEGTLQSNTPIENTESAQDNLSFPTESAPEETISETTEETVEAGTQEQDTENELTPLEPVETPESESVASTEESSLNSDNAPTFESMLAERTNGQYKSWDDVENIINQQEASQPQFANELIARLNQLAEQGVDVDLNFVQSQLKDYTTFDPSDTNQALELIKMELKLNEPDITDREIEWEIKDKFHLDSDEYGEDVVERSKMRLMRDAKKAQKNLTDHQSKMALPNGIDPQEKARQEQQQRAAIESLNNDIRTTVNQYRGEKFTIGNEQFEYKLDNDTKSRLQSTMMNVNSFFTRYMNQDGSIDYGSWSRDMFRLENFDKIVGSITKQAMATGSRGIVKDLKNTNKKGQAASSTPSKPKSIQDQLAAHFMNKPGGAR